MNLNSWLEEKRSVFDTIIIGDIKYTLMCLDTQLPNGDIISEIRYKVKTLAKTPDELIRNTNLRYEPVHVCVNPVKFYILLMTTISNHFKLVSPAYVYTHFTNKRFLKIYTYYFKKIVKHAQLVDYNPYTGETLNKDNEFVFKLK